MNCERHRPCPHGGDLPATQPIPLLCLSHPPKHPFCKQKQKEDVSFPCLQLKRLSMAPLLPREASSSPACHSELCQAHASSPFQPGPLPALQNAPDSEACDPVCQGAPPPSDATSCVFLGLVQNSTEPLFPPEPDVWGGRRATPGSVGQPSPLSHAWSVSSPFSELDMVLIRFGRTGPISQLCTAAPDRRQSVCLSFQTAVAFLSFHQ